jgi:hypothetical protein
MSYTGLTSKQIAFVKENYTVKVSLPQKAEDYSCPMQNTIDRNIQEQLLRSNPSYNWGQEDKKSFGKNCGNGPHGWNLGRYLIA